MLSPEAQVYETQELQTRTRVRISALLVIGFSLFYFTNVLLRAWEKQFWFDEIVTVYMCRLPSLHAVQQALVHGVDFNPMFFYVISRTSRALFGENPIGMRVPQMVGFWLFCVCLFRFVNRRAGPLAGLIAMALPTLTGGFYYAFEARPHGIIVGFCGLAIVLWQICGEKRFQTPYLIAFSLSLLGAFMLHCFAFLLVIPFAIVELWRNCEARRIHWRMWVALTAPVIVAAATYLPLFFAFQSQASSNDLFTSFPPSVSQIGGFYHFLLGGCMPPLVVALTLLIADKLMNTSLPSWEEESTRSDLKFELILGAAFLAMPVFGLFPSAILHAPYLQRYFISSAAGLGILIGFAMGIRLRWNWIPAAVALVMAGSISWNYLALMWHAFRGQAEEMWEPSAAILLNTTPGDPLAIHKLLKKAADNSKPIVVLRGLEFIYLTFYAPEFRSRIYFVSDSKKGSDYQGLQNLRAWSPAEYNPPRVTSEFLKTFPHYLVYSDLGYVQEFTDLLQKGGALKSMEFVRGHFLADVVVK